jgi:hypothetical protein
MEDPIMTLGRLYEVAVVALSAISVASLVAIRI